MMRDAADPYQQLPNSQTHTKSHTHQTSAPTLIRSSKALQDDSLYKLSLYITNLWKFETKFSVLMHNVLVLWNTTQTFTHGIKLTPDHSLVSWLHFVNSPKRLGQNPQRLHKKTTPRDPPAPPLSGSGRTWLYFGPHWGRRHKACYCGGVWRTQRCRRLPWWSSWTLAEKKDPCAAGLSAGRVVGWMFSFSSQYIRHCGTNTYTWCRPVLFS